MKRSEMVKIINDCFWDMYNVSFDIHDFDASLILSVIEKAGMLPPHVLGAKHWDEDNYWEPEK